MITREMKITAILCLCSGVVFAQDRVNVPLSDPSRPATVHVHLLSGTITVHGGGGKEIIVETSGGRSDEGSHERSAPPNVAGMHRLDVNAGLDVVEENNVVNIKTTSWSRHSNLTITVPYRCSLELKTVTNGEIEVERVDGEIDADALNGKITLKDVSGSVLAHTLNGEIRANLDRVDPTKPMSFSTLNGEIDVTLPADLRANFRLKTDNGEIYTDFDVKLDPGSHAVTSDPDERRGGGHHLRIDRTIRGTVNGGGPEYQFTSFNGQIFIRKKK
jgi:Toastrack DUF4097